MAATNEEHTVISLALHLLDPSNARALTDYKHCLGWSVSAERQCEKPIGKTRRAIAAERHDLLFGMQNTPLNEERIESVLHFLEHRHCISHRERLIRRFLQWKSDNCDVKVTAQSAEEARFDMPSSSPDHATAGVDGEPDSEVDEEVSTVAVSQSGLYHSKEDETISEEFADLSISPGQESDITFGCESESVASTAPTTPDATPISLRSLPILDETDDRPETSSDTITDEVLEQDPDAQNLLQQAERKGPGMRASLMRRMGTQKRGKLPLLIGIEHDWTPMDYESGKVYIFKHDNQHDLIKIGWTRSNSQTRHAQRGNCYAMDTKPHWESSEPFVGAYRVEQLVQRQLHERNVLNENKNKFACCNRGHREWFRCDADEAVLLIELWTEFVTGGYYDHYTDSDGNRCGMLNQAGRAFMDGACNVTPQALKGLLQAGNLEDSVVVTEEGAVDNLVTEESVREDVEAVPSHAGENTSFHTREREGKQRARWYAKQLFDILSVRVKESVSSPFRRSLGSILNGHRGVTDESHRQQPSGTDEAMLKFYRLFYANEIHEIKEDGTLQSGDPVEGQRKGWTFGPWRRES